MNLTHRIAQTIQSRSIFRRDDLLLVALSGGADSVALLLVLKELGYKLHAMHCNFHLRGEESDRDERFVTDLCLQHNIPLHIRHFDTTTYASEHKVSIEMAARELRYEWFNEQRQLLNAQHIVVAHHRNDQAETLLLNIIRGTGLRGLAGMKYTNGHICRPMLDVSRDDILDYLSHKGQDYVTDSTNLERDAMRNKLRLDILPALQTLNPSIHETLATLALNIQDALPIYEKGLEASTITRDMVPSSKPGDTFASSHTSAFPSRQPIATASLTLLHEWLSPCGFTRTQLQNILTAETGRIIESATHRLLRDRSDFILQERNRRKESKRLLYETLSADEVGKMERGNAYLDKDKIKLPIQRRPVQPSDRFTPLGMKGSKLVSDYLTDLKLNRFEKEEQEVLTDADGRILWIIGYATDHRFRITPSTRNVLCIKVNKPRNLPQ